MKRFLCLLLMVCVGLSVFGDEENKKLLNEFETAEVKRNTDFSWTWLFLYFDHQPYLYLDDVAFKAAESSHEDLDRTFEDYVTSVQRYTYIPVLAPVPTLFGNNLDLDDSYSNLFWSSNLVLDSGLKDDDILEISQLEKDKGGWKVLGIFTSYATVTCIGASIYGLTQIDKLSTLKPGSEGLIIGLAAGSLLVYLAQYGINSTIEAYNQEIEKRYKRIADRLN